MILHVGEKAPEFEMRSDRMELVKLSALIESCIL